MIEKETPAKIYSCRRYGDDIIMHVLFLLAYLLKSRTNNLLIL